ncbi:MAG: type IX secretion system sortase PorU [Bacteroidota bacterium]|nr:type IX secretion system sortase PorU [Bacteroidota bacterium]
MYKQIVIAFLFFIIAGVGLSQTKEFSCQIEWKKNDIISIDSLNQIERFYFQNAIYPENLVIPHFVERISMHEKRIQNAKIIVLRTKKISAEDLYGIDQLELDKLSSDFLLTHIYTTIRKKQFAYLDVLPIRKLENGEFERLVDFEIKLEFTDAPEIKSSRAYAENSKLSDGDWYKFRVSESGVYSISYQEVANLGFDNPSDIGVFGYGYMVPKLNVNSRYDDLPERPVYHKDNNGNGMFDSGDYLLVFLEGPNEFKYSGSLYEHVIHNYSTYAYYFLSDNSQKKRVQFVDGAGEADYVTSTYDYYASMEKDSINIMGSGRNFYWRKFSYYLSYNFDFNVPSPVSSEDATMVLRFAAASSVDSRFKVTFNGDVSYSQYISSVSGSYSASVAKTIEYQMNANVNSTNSLNIEYLPSTSSSEAWLDYITINTRANLQLQNSELQFRDAQGIGSGNVTQYILGGANASTKILDVSDPVNAFGVNPDALDGSSLKFSVESDQLREFVAFNTSSAFPSPQFEGSSALGFVENQNLHALSQVDYLIISYPDFVSYAEQLGALHESYSGLSYHVVTPEVIFNEFSSGTRDVAAMRDFVKMFYDRAASDSQIPKYLLMFGDGSYDNRAPMGENGNYVPTYQAVNSLSPSSSFVSDDFFVLLDDEEGSVNGTEGLDIGIGRLPVRSQTEAEGVLNKIFAYISPESFGNWRNVMSFIGDDAEDYMAHQIQANEMGDTVMVHHQEFNVDKILLDAYEQVSTVQGDRYPEVNQKIDERVNHGSLIVNYSGHGNEKTLAHEAVVTLSQINSWSNGNKLPLFVTATCEFAPYDDYELTSAGELIILNPDGGGIALLTTTRLVYSGSNDRINKEFYRQVFKTDENNMPYALGEIIMHTKNLSSSSTDINKRNFSLLGDPALRLAIPEYIVKTDSIGGNSVTVYEDTLSAASMVRIEGHIEDRSGNIKSDFNGVVYPTVYDKVMEYSTLGNDENPPMDFLEQKNILYSGQASVTNGYFSFEFIVPVDIAYFYGNGKISYYAASDSKDAHGYYDGFYIGGSSDTDITDNFGPEIELFMNNTDFIDGGITDENPILLAYIFDDSGINTVGNGIGHDITAVLDYNTLNAIVLNDFYEADLDSYQSGSVRYPFFDLETGLHSLTFKVWDVFNNSSEAEISFLVANSSELVVEQLMNYPNPLSDYTCFTFTHNHPNEEMEVEIKIFNMNGQLIKIIQENVYATGYTVDDICWYSDNGGGGSVEQGVYIYHVQVRSENGDVVNKFEKMVVVK